MEQTELQILSPDRTRMELGNGNTSGEVQREPALRPQTGSTKAKIFAGLFGAASIVIVVLVMVLVTGIHRRCEWDSTFKPGSSVRSDFSISTRMSSIKLNLKLLNSTCGLSFSERIANGKETSVSQYPWMALLLDSKGNVFCGGTLISERYVLTAAHCFHSEHTLTVRLGEHNTSSPIDCEDIYEENCAPPVQDFNVTKKDIIQHEFYSPKMRSNDIALIRLPRPANMADNRVLPICLPHGDFKDFKDVEPGSKMTIAGWGQTEGGTTSNVLMHAAVTVTTSRACIRDYNKTNTKIWIDERSLCAAGESGQNHCVGDSGGPLQLFKMAQIDNVNRTVAVQHGIITFGEKDCTLDSLTGVYLKVSYYMDWILYNMTE